MVLVESMFITLYLKLISQDPYEMEWIDKQAKIFMIIVFTVFLFAVIKALGFIRIVDKEEEEEVSEEVFENVSGSSACN